MIRKSGDRFSEKIMLNKKIEQDDESKRSHLALRGPALRLAHHEVAEHLHARHRLQLFRIDEIGVDLDRVGLAEQLHQAVVLLDQIVRQCCDAEALLTGPDKS